MAKQVEELQRGLLHLRACLNEMSWHCIGVEKVIIASAVPSVLLSEAPTVLFSAETVPTEQDNYLFIQFMHCHVCWRNPAAE